ncbi:MAG: hypothetical protein SGI97_10070 [candidate division Zixibacteria bacterium]|nr:hypothetical protein [candidate division Zixibacteria bacterium]
MATDGLICWNCGKPTGIADRVNRADACVACLADLRCCRGCRHFDPTRRFQCMEPIETNIPHKEKSNFCDFFQMRLAIKGPGGLVKKTDTKDSLKKKFDDLFSD